MSCYNDLIDKIRAKDIPKAETDSLMEWGFSALEKADPSVYTQIMYKMEDMVYKMGLSDAERIVREMKPYGEKWTVRDVKDVMQAHDVTDSTAEWYAVMNMVWNDYRSTADMIGHGNDVEFYFSLAKDFITDPDARRHKVAKYFMG